MDKLSGPKQQHSFKEPRWLGPAPSGARLDLYDRETDQRRRKVSFCRERGYLLIGNGQGANPAVDVVIAGVDVGELHAAVAFHREHKKPYLIDMGAGETRLRGQRVEPLRPVPLVDGARIEFGTSSQYLRLRLRDTAERPLSSVASEVSLETDQVRARHILIKHRDVRNPVSKRTGEPIRRSREVARDHIEHLRQRILNGEASFEEIARTESDCNSFKRDGDLGWFDFKAMQEAFARVAFLELERPGDLSDVVETSSGFHLIQLLDRKGGVPAAQNAARAHDGSAGKPDPNRAISATDVFFVRHILVKHVGSRNPVDLEGRPIVRSKAEARALLAQFQGTILKGLVTFEHIALQHSDCKSGRYGGRIRPFGPGEMHAEFERAVRSLEPGTLSSIVETPSGLHLIEVLARGEDALRMTNANAEASTWSSELV
ncbi:hypothetical protein CCYA_CCYA13G3484 [Cyanidiococcus yangmingshanensis]|nr:hypothetical protein CCYA_CCYA13G3484 [Cyanidiococcus yangmingshanensis]